MLFTTQIENNSLIAGIIKNNDFSKVDFSSLEYIVHWDNHYTFRDIKIGDFIFETLEIRISANGIFMIFLSNNTVFYDHPVRFFETEGVAVEHEPFAEGQTEIKEFRRKLGTFKICDKSARISVLKSDSYGTMIKVTFI